MEENTTVKTFTEEEVERDYVKKADYDALVEQYKELVKGFNQLATEYNELHIKSLLPTLTSETKKA